MSTEIGMLIRKRREELGITQEQLAKKLNYKSKSTINKIENGTNDITGPKIMAFANALNVPPSFLMGWESENKDIEVKVTDMDNLILEEPLYMNVCLSYIIKIARINKGIAEKKLAALICIPLETYLYFENNATNLSTDNIVRAMEMLGLNYYYVLGYLHATREHIHSILNNTSDEEMRSFLYKLISDNIDRMYA